MTTMDRDEALKLLRGGEEGIAEWNRRRAEGEEIPRLVDANLAGKALVGANLAGAILEKANLDGASLCNANLRKASLTFASLIRTDLEDANLHMTGLEFSVVKGATLGGANLRAANLQNTILVDPIVERTEFTLARLGESVLASMDLSISRGLAKVIHNGPSKISTDTLVASKGRIPDAFLRGCGLAPWEVIAAKLYDPDLTNSEVNDLQFKFFEARTSGPIVLGGVFISYSHDDATFVDKIRDKLDEKGVPVWLDRHEMVAGPLQEQVDRALRLNDVVLLVLSELSVESDWVEYELETAIKKEKQQKRPILCPVAIDASWEDKMGDVLWRQVKKKNVLDFAKWKTKAFEPQFQKLLKGLKIYYEKPGEEK